MKKKKGAAAFAAGLTAVLLIAGAVLGVLNHFYVNGYYYTDVYTEVEKMKNVPMNIKMANFGTSHGLACFRYPEDATDCFNFALSGEDIYHDFATLQQFASHFAPGCIVAIPTSYFSFCMSTEEPSQKRYYMYLDRKYLRGFQYETLLNAKYLPVLRSGEFLIKDLIKDQSMDVGAAMMEEQVQTDAAAPAPAETVPVVGTGSSSADAIAALKSHAAGRVESWRAGYMRAGRDFIPENIALLQDMVQFCLDSGLRPVLVTTPVYEALNENFDQDELAQCYFNPIAAVQAATGVPYFDFSHDPQLSTHPEYYGNSDHMNAVGAAAFYSEYLARLQALSYLQ